MENIEIKNELDCKLEIVVETKSKCGEVFVTKNGEISCLCLICHQDFGSFDIFSSHILCDHLKLEYFGELTEYEISKNCFGQKSISEKSNEENSLQLSKNVEILRKSCECLLSHESNCFLKTEIDVPLENMQSVAVISQLFEENYKTRSIYKIHESLQKGDELKINDEGHEINFNNYPKYKSLGNKALPLENIKMKRCSVLCTDLTKNIHMDSENDNNNVHTSGSHKCEQCYKSFNNQNLLKKHAKSHKKKCDFCIKQFSSKKDYEMHMNVHGKLSKDQDKGMKCSYCPKIFQKLINLEKHEERHKRIQICEYCGKLFENQKAKYQQHLRSHTGEKPFVCSVCSNAFTTRGNLNHHKSTCHSDERPFICTWSNCGKGFKKDRQRVWHERIHTGEKPYQCEQCGEHFAFQHKLSLHKKQKHMDKKDRPHKCDQCEKAFVLPRQLREHKYTHTGEKPHECDMCPARFAKRGALTEHKKLHTGEKKHVCEICGRAFAQRAGYATHIKSHNFI